MTLLSLTAYGRTHDASRQAAAKWQQRGYLVMDGSMVDAEASDAQMENFGKGRFRIKAHGGRRQAGVRGVVDRPGLDQAPPSPAPPPADEPWNGWHRAGNPNTLSTAIREAIESGDPDDLDDALDGVDYAAWDEASKDAGWDRWPATAAAAIASELGIDDQAKVREVLHRHVTIRLADLGCSPEDVADPRLHPR